MRIRGLPSPPCLEGEWPAPAPLGLEQDLTVNEDRRHGRGGLRSGVVCPPPLPLIRRSSVRIFQRWIRPIDEMLRCSTLRPVAKSGEIAVESTDNSPNLAAGSGAFSAMPADRLTSDSERTGTYRVHTRDFLQASPSRPERPVACAHVEV
jgi:hypothetical protein